MEHLIEDRQTQAEVEATRRLAAEEDWSLSNRVQAAWKIALAAERRASGSADEADDDDSIDDELVTRAHPGHAIGGADGIEVLEYRLLRVDLAAYARAAQPKKRGEHSTLQLAREVSRVTGSALWLCRGDHSAVGGFARFERGEIADQAGDGDPYVTDDDYVDVPEAKWRAATRSRLSIAEVFSEAIDNEALCLLDIDDPEARIAFDPDHHRIAWTDADAHPAVASASRSR